MFSILLVTMVAGSHALAVNVEAVKCDYREDVCQTQIDKELARIQSETEAFFKNKPAWREVKNTLLEFLKADIEWANYDDSSGTALKAFGERQREIGERSLAFQNLKTLQQMNDQSKPVSFTEEDKLLNKNYKMCLENNEDNPGDKPELARTAQRKWLKYRDAVLATVLSKLLKEKVAGKITQFRNAELKACAPH